MQRSFILFQNISLIQNNLNNLNIFSLPRSSIFEFYSIFKNVFPMLIEFPQVYYQQQCSNLLNLSIQMSIYSGLPTRQDQTNYNKLLCRLITTMQEHIIQLCNGVVASHFCSKYSKLIARMQTYEEHKYLPPKFTTLLKPLEEIMRDSIARRPSNQGIQFNLKLEAVKEEEQLPSSRQLAKHKTQINMKKSILKNKKMHQKSSMLSESDVKQKNARSYSVFSQKKSRVDLQLKKVEKLNPRETLADFVYKRQNQIRSSGSGYKYRTKSRHMITEPGRTNGKEQKNLMKALSEAVQNNDGENKI